MASPVDIQKTIIPSHYGPEQPRNQTLVLGHSLVRSLTPLCTGCFRRMLPCAHAFARLLTHYRAHGKVYTKISQNDLILSHSACLADAGAVFPAAASARSQRTTAKATKTSTDDAAAGTPAAARQGACRHSAPRP